MTALIIPLYSLLFGLSIGSFANVVIHRLHSGKGGILSGRSECPYCRHVLEFWDLIPVLSWIFLRGKCRYCRKKISLQYPIVELLMGLLWVFTVTIMPVDIWASSWMEWVRLFLMLFVVSALLIITIYDLKYLEIPDQVSLPVIVVLLLTLPFDFTPTWTDALLGAAIPVGFFALQIVISRGKWIGAGDLRLGAIMGLLLGWQKTLLSLFIAYFLGAVVGLFLISVGKKKMGSEIPFGPFLAIATVAGVFWGEELLEIYLRITRLG